MNNLCNYKQAAIGPFCVVVWRTKIRVLRDCRTNNKRAYIPPNFFCKTRIMGAKLLEFWHGKNELYQGFYGVVVFLRILLRNSVMPKYEAIVCKGTRCSISECAAQNSR